MRCCHFARSSLLIFVFRSVYGILNSSGVRFKADLAAKFDLSSPLTPMWLGIQHIIIYLQCDNDSSLCNSLIINGFSSFLLLSDCKNEIEAENLTNFLCFLFESLVYWTGFGCEDESFHLKSFF